jgi:ferritin-like metal-binding protein YciE
MSELTTTEMFERELRKLYHAELEILDLHADLAAAAASEEVETLFTGHEEDTVEQIHRLERLFDELGEEARAEGSPIMEGILAEKDALVATDAPDDLRDLGVLRTGMMNERFEITVLNQLLLLAGDLDFPADIVRSLEANRSEATTALREMETIVERRRIK